MERLHKTYGDSIPHAGAKFFRTGALWHPGILFSWGHKSEIVMIDLQGSRLACTPVTESMDLTFEILAHGFHCTRVDLAVDHVDANIGLHKHALASCKTGELCKLRTYADDSEFKADGTPLRFLLKLGKRTSSICARIYDKGLETKSMTAGKWERFEVEFKGDAASETCMSLCMNSFNLQELIWRYVIGSIDYRVVNRRSELERRPRSDWWREYIGLGVPLRPLVKQPESGFDSWRQWYRTSVGPRLIQLATLTGKTPLEFTRELLENLQPAVSQTSATLEAKLLGKSLR